MSTEVKVIIAIVMIVSLIGAGLVIFVTSDYGGKNIPRAGKPIVPDSYQQWNVSQWEDWATSIYNDHPGLRQYLPYWFNQIMQNRSG